MGPLDTDRLPCLAAQLPDPGTGSPVILGLTFLVGVKDMDKQSRVAIQLPGEGQWLEKGAAGLPSICLGKPEQSLADPPGEKNGIGETPQLGPAPNKGMRETRDKWNTELEAGRGSIKRGNEERTSGISDSGQDRKAQFPSGLVPVVISDDGHWGQQRASTAKEMDQSGAGVHCWQ